MVTRLIVVLAALCLAGFIYLWLPGALLVAGVGLLWLAAVRTANERKGARR